MKYILEHIGQRSTAFAQHSLFRYLRDDDIDPRERLKFVPCASHFVMTFADLYHFFLVEEPPSDRYQELVNTHLAEEGDHWKWFLADLTNMGLDPAIRFTDALRFLWSDVTEKTRALAYEMCKLSAGKSSLQKLVMVQSIEATGRIALEAAVPAGREAATRLGRSLVYFGQHHLDTERQHTMEENSIQDELENIELGEDERRELCAIVDQVFEHFIGFMDDAFGFVKSGRSLPEASAAQAVALA